MIEICIMLLNISILVVYLTNKDNYKYLNKKILRQKDELLQYIIDNRVEIQEKHQKDIKAIIEAIEDGTLKKKVKTKKKN